MKYKLKKDLPFAKAGTLIYVDAEEGSKIIFDNEFITISGRRSLERLLNEGWIEEAKPREWYISESVLRDYAKEHKDLFVGGYTRHDLIKISEVIE